MLEDSDRSRRGARGRAPRSRPARSTRRPAYDGSRGCCSQTGPTSSTSTMSQPLISPWVVRVAGKHGVPVVQTVHAYRHGCVNGLHLRDGHVCTDCVGTRLGAAGRPPRLLPRLSRSRRCRSRSGLVVHRRTWRDGVGPLPRAHRRSCATCSSATASRPNGSRCARPGSPTRASRRPGPDVLYVGRLDEAKGRRPAPRRLGARAGRRATGARDRRRRPARRPGACRTRRRPDGRAGLARSPPERVGRAMAEAAYVVVPVARLRGLPAGGGRGVRPRAAGADRLRWQRRHDRRRRDRLGGRADVEALAEAIRTITDQDARPGRTPLGPVTWHRAPRSRGWRRC